MRKFTKIIVIFVVGILLVASFVYFVSPGSNASLRVGLGFAGYSTDTNGQACATFNLTNQSSVAISRRGFFNYEIQKPGAPTYTYTLEPDVILAPGKSEVILMPLFSQITNQGPWRAIFGYSQKGVGNDFRKWVATWPFVPWHLRVVPFKMVPSQWIDPGKEGALPQPIATGEDKTIAHPRPPDSSE